MDILPYYYPTTVQFVDDNRGFLTNLTLELDETLAYRLYDSPLEALEFVAEQANKLSAARGSFARLIDVSGYPPSEYALHLNIVNLAAEIKNRRRFSEVSVAVVDYDMGGMTGLELCEKYRGYGLKTILLTGVADERTAVDAFNRGIIDFYVPKSAPQAREMLNQAIKRLQKKHFQESIAFLAAALEVAESGLLGDPGFAMFFNNVCQEQRFVEYYLLPGQRGFLLLTAKGKPAVLLVQTEEQLREQHEIALGEQAAEDLIVGLAEKLIVPYFCSSDGYFRSDSDFFCFAASRLQTSKAVYYWSLVDEPPFLDFEDEEAFSYETYLKKLDILGQTSWV